MYYSYLVNIPCTHRLLRPAHFSRPSHDGRTPLCTGNSCHWPLDVSNKATAMTVQQAFGTYYVCVHSTCVIAITSIHITLYREGDYIIMQMVMCLAACYTTAVCKSFRAMALVEYICIYAYLDFNVGR